MRSARPKMWEGGGALERNVGFSTGDGEFLKSFLRGATGADKHSQHGGYWGCSTDCGVQRSNYPSIYTEMGIK